MCLIYRAGHEREGINTRKHKHFREERLVAMRGPGEGDETQMVLREVKARGEEETQKLIIKYNQCDKFIT